MTDLKPWEIPMDHGVSAITVYDGDGDLFDWMDDAGTFEAMCYGDLQYYSGPYRVVVGSAHDDLAAAVQHAIDINEDCWGLTGSTIERTLV